MRQASTKPDIATLVHDTQLFVKIWWNINVLCLREPSVNANALNSRNANMIFGAVKKLYYCLANLKTISKQQNLTIWIYLHQWSIMYTDLLYRGHVNFALRLWPQLSGIQVTAKTPWHCLGQKWNLTNLRYLKTNSEYLIDDQITDVDLLSFASQS